MSKRLLVLVLSIVLCFSSAFANQRSHSSSGSRSHSASTSKASSSKTVHVRSYTRKDGTVVRSHDRSAPGTKAHTTARVRSSTTTIPALRDSRGHIKRTAAAKEDFERETGYPHGRKGYVVDHIKPLACGGADVPSNMQWQTVAEAKAKDKTERIGCN